MFVHPQRILSPPPNNEWICWLFLVVFFAKFAQFYFYEARQSKRFCTLMILFICRLFAQFAQVYFYEARRSKRFCTQTMMDDGWACGVYRLMVVRAVAALRRCGVDKQPTSQPTAQPTTVSE